MEPGFESRFKHPLTGDAVRLRPHPTGLPRHGWDFIFLPEILLPTCRRLLYRSTALADSAHKSTSPGAALDRNWWELGHKYSSSLTPHVHYLTGKRPASHFPLGSELRLPARYLAWWFALHWLPSLSWLISSLPVGTFLTPPSRQNYSPSNLWLNVFFLGNQTLVPEHKLLTTAYRMLKKTHYIPTSALKGGHERLEAVGPGPLSKYQSLKCTEPQGMRAKNQSPEVHGVTGLRHIREIELGESSPWLTSSF